MFIITHAVQRRIRWADRYGRTGKNSHFIAVYFEGLFIITPTCLNKRHVRKVVHFHIRY